MKTAAKNWIWFIALMMLVLGVGLYLGGRRRSELGRGFRYSLEDYRTVDPALVKYRETAPYVPSVGPITALTIGDDGKMYIAGRNAIEIAGAGKIPVSDSPTCLAVDEDGILFAGFHDHVQVIGKDGTAVEWASPGDKAHLTSIDVDDVYVYAADAGSRRIWRYRKEGGEPLEIGRKDAANGVRGFFIPSPSFDLAVSHADGSLWAVNPGHHALENYHSDGMLISSWEASSMMIEGFSGCCNPSHFALLPAGAFVTAEKGLPRVKIHNVDGSLRCVVAVPGRFDEDASGLDLAVDEEGRIYVLDPGRNQVRIFEEIR
jgi:DNA-binding beta-propeller fold protein YncE